MLSCFKDFCCQKGFSLTELSVSLAIVAVIAGSAISVAISSDNNARIVQTSDKLDRIEEAIAGYLANNTRIPCPSDPALATSHANFGLENVAAGTPDTCDNTPLDSGNINGGGVPVRTLQLPDDFSFDGWGRRITYTVDERFANNASTTTCAGDCFVDTAAGTITVNDDSGTARTTTAVYVLVSHGENGHGAYIKAGSATRFNAFGGNNPHPVHASELANAHVQADGSPTAPAYDTVFYQRQEIKFLDETTPANSIIFDDIVRFKTKSQIIREADAVFYESLCNTAKTVVDNPGSNDCTSAASEANCESFAIELDNICIQ